MAARRPLYGDVESKSDLEEIFRGIRRDAHGAKSREGLTELYRRAGYLIALTQAPSWRKKFGARSAGLQRDAESEFSTTAREINRRAKKIGEDGDYDERWGN